MREPTRFATLTGEGGQRLHAELFVRDNAKGVVLVTHGYAEHCGRYREVADVLVNAGWSVLTWDVRGHGQSPGPRGYCDRFSQYLGDFRAAHRAARELGPGPLVALGHSHGSLITLRAALEPAPPEMAALVLSSPFLGFGAPISPVKAALGKVASRLRPQLSLPNGLKLEDLTSDPGKQAERAKDKLCFDIATARWFTEAVTAHREVEDGASRIAVPALWLIGGADVIASPAQSRKVAARMPKATVRVFEGYCHEVFNETKRAVVFEELTRFLATVAP
ncbi:MAG: alpha/beta hydrolase [Myxococcales bacterium]|nr:alpha/beta hydrolase [Myxococcales bacterium]HRC58419.1 lysophospholipase [Kofleriaceae bacterium]